MLRSETIAIGSVLQAGSYPGNVFAVSASG